MFEIHGMYSFTQSYEAPFLAALLGKKGIRSNSLTADAYLGAVVRSALERWPYALVAYSPLWTCGLLARVQQS